MTTNTKELIIMDTVKRHVRNWAIFALVLAVVGLPMLFGEEGWAYYILWLGNIFLILLFFAPLFYTIRLIVKPSGGDDPYADAERIYLEHDRMSRDMGYRHTNDDGVIVDEPMPGAYVSNEYKARSRTYNPHDAHVVPTREYMPRNDAQRPQDNDHYDMIIDEDGNWYGR